MPLKPETLLVLSIEVSGRIIVRAASHLLTAEHSDVALPVPQS